jgi:hypothetical protein
MRLRFSKRVRSICPEPRPAIRGRSDKRDASPKRRPIAIAPLSPATSLPSNGPSPSPSALRKPTLPALRGGRMNGLSAVILPFSLFEDPASPAAPDIPVRQVDTASRRAAISSRTGGEVKRDLAEWLQPHDVQRISCSGGRRCPFRTPLNIATAIVCNATKNIEWWDFITLCCLNLRCHGCCPIR